MADVVRLEQESVNEAANRCITNMLREEMHVTALTIVSLPECDGMTAEFLLSQPLEAIEEYINGVTEEVS
jgi:hypothetical protein